MKNPNPSFAAFGPRPLALRNSIAPVCEGKDCMMDSGIDCVNGLSMPVPSLFQL